MVDVDAKPKAKPKPKVAQPKPKKSAASSAPGVDASGSNEPQATPVKRARSPSDEAPAAHGDEEQTQQESQQLVMPHKEKRSPTLEPKGQSPSPEGLENFANFTVGPHQQPNHISKPRKELDWGTNDDGDWGITAMMRHWYQQNHHHVSS